MSRSAEIRLMTKVARMYYNQGIRQQEITERLSIHQSTVSRLLKRARESGIVRISVAIPAGIFSELEEGLEVRYGLQEAIVVDSVEDEERISRDLGAAAAFFLETTIKPGMTIGISSWSRALVAMVDSLYGTACGQGGTVVQVLGGVGTAGSEYHATQLARELAARIGAVPVLLQAPGVVATAQAREVLAKDPAVMAAAKLFKKVDVALVGIGAVEPSKLLASSGNAFSPAEQEKIRAQGAVGDICLRFFDRNGVLIQSPLMERVIGIELPVLKKAAKVVGIAGGRRKLDAIRATLLGNWVNVLITDRRTAEDLLTEQPGI